MRKNETWKTWYLMSCKLKSGKVKVKARAIWIQSSCFDLYAIKIAPYKYKWVIQKINLGISTKENLRRNFYLWFIRNSTWRRLSSFVWNFRRESPWNVKLCIFGFILIEFEKKIWQLLSHKPHYSLLPQIMPFNTCVKPAWACKHLDFWILRRKMVEV